MWSKLINVGVGIVAKDYYDLNLCQYHNWQHILDCYAYLEENNVPYSEELDFAVMHHDIVYDEWPNKEARSAGFLSTRYPDMTGAVDTIMSTADHRVRDKDELCRWMIRADLHQLADPKLALDNYVKLMNESMKLYSVTEYEFARANLEFMKTLRDTVVDNHLVDTDQFWLDVMLGIDLTMQVSSAMLTVQRTTQQIKG
jgi:predicted metal-dependent HD superfamily phosphohydrolase